MQVLDSKDFNIVLKLVDTLKNKTLNDGSVKKAYTTGFDDMGKNILSKLLSPYLIPTIGNFKIHVVMLLEEFVPWCIHTDYNKGDENPGYAILIPLETVDSNTVIFNEECTDDFETFKKNSPILENNSLFLADSLLSHVPVEKLKYVSLKSVEKWEQGKLIIWDRRLLHTSDNFKQTGLEQKRAVVVFTSKINP